MWLRTYQDMGQCGMRNAVCFGGWREPLRDNDSVVEQNGSATGEGGLRYGREGAAIWERGCGPAVHGVPLLGVTVGYIVDTQCDKIIQFAKLPKSDDAMPLKYCFGSFCLSENH